MFSEHDVCDTVYFQMTRALLTEKEITELAAARNYDVDDLGFQLSYIRYCGQDWRRRIATGTTNIKLYPLIPRYPGDNCPISMEEYQRRIKEAMKEFDAEPTLPYIRSTFYEILETFRRDKGRHYNTVVDLPKLQQYISDNLYVKQHPSVRGSILMRKRTVAEELAGLAGGNIDKMLALVQSVKEDELRLGLRTGLLAQMYGINETNVNDGSPYFTMVNDNCAILQTGKFSFVIKPNGDLKFTPYHFKLDDSRPSKLGWHTEATIDQQQKFGLYTPIGSELLPCRFDDVNIWDYDVPVVSLNGHRFRIITQEFPAVFSKECCICRHPDSCSFFYFEEIVEGNDSSEASAIAAEELEEIMKPELCVGK